ncbi:MAG: DUF2203 domain-containing protein [Nitrospinales bacterium]
MAFKKHFTVNEANSLVPRLLKDVPRIQSLAARLANQFPDVEKARENARFNGGSEQGSAYLQVALQLNRAMNDLSDEGCIIKGIAEGLVDFPAILNGREVFLCWKIPEEEVRFWHDLDAGYAGRQKL